MIKKLVVLLGPLLSREVVVKGLTHSDETTRGSGMSEQEVTEMCPICREEEMEKAKSNESKHYIDILDFVLV